jgi:hypothetical protein
VHFLMQVEGLANELVELQGDVARAAAKAPRAGLLPLPTTPSVGSNASMPTPGSVCQVNHLMSKSSSHCASVDTLEAQLATMSEQTTESLARLRDDLEWVAHAAEVMAVGLHPSPASSPMPLKNKGNSMGTMAQGNTQAGALQRLVQLLQGRVAPHSTASEPSGRHDCQGRGPGGREASEHCLGSSSGSGSQQHNAKGL